MKVEYVLVVLASLAAFAAVGTRDSRGRTTSDFRCGPVVVEINSGREDTEAFYTSLGVEIALRDGGRMLATEFPKPVRKYLEHVCHAAYENEQRKQEGEKASR